MRNRGGPCCESHDCLGASAAGTACVNFAPWLQPGGVGLENADVSRKAQRKQRAPAGKSMHKRKNVARIQVSAEKCTRKEEDVARTLCVCIKLHGKGRKSSTNTVFFPCEMQTKEGNIAFSQEDACKSEKN